MIRDVCAHLEIDVAPGPEFSGQIVRSQLCQIEITDVRTDSEIARPALADLEDPTLSILQTGYNSIQGPVKTSGRNPVKKVQRRRSSRDNGTAGRRATPAHGDQGECGLGRYSDGRHAQADILKSAGVALYRIAVQVI